MEKIILTTIDELKEALRVVLAEERQSKTLTDTEKPNSHIPELLTVEETCVVLRIRSRSTLYEIVKQHRLPYKKIGRKTLFAKQDLLKFLTVKNSKKL